MDEKTPITKVDKETFFSPENNLEEKLREEIMEDSRNAMEKQ